MEHRFSYNVEVVLFIYLSTYINPLRHVCDYIMFLARPGGGSCKNAETTFINKCKFLLSRVKYSSMQIKVDTEFCLRVE